ncbi:MAG: GNAT family N-acetyltransferase [Legionella sp.]|jgi:N-acetylglutamate synthase-like GNAT family acetyltransferase
MNKVNFVVDSNPKEKDNEFLRKQIIEFNRSVLHEQATQFSVLVKTDVGDIIGGATIWEHSDALYIDILWIDDIYRHKKIGTQLISKLFEQALIKNIRKIFVDTYDFQASEFYIKQGFRVIGRLENYLLGHDRIYFRKDLG